MTTSGTIAGFTIPHAGHLTADDFKRVAKPSDIVRSPVGVNVLDSLRCSLLRVAALTLLMVSIVVAQRGNPSQVRPIPVGDVIAPWERIVRGAYENKGLAQVERIGDRWVLNVMCDGTHATYIDDTEIDLTAYSKGYVSARYHYVERTTNDPQCVQAPCAPVRDRRIALERLTIVTASPEQARDMARECRSPAGK